MSNEDLPQSVESASAYLDGELDADQRAEAAADPEVMAAVESFARVRAALSDVQPVVASTKTAALAAALAEFDALRATPSPATMTAAAPATVVSLQSRRVRAYRVLTGVAAAVVVGVVAIAALNSTRGNNADLASSATQAPTAAAALPQLKVEAPAATAAPGADAAAQSAEATAPAIDNKAQLQQYAASIEAGASTAAGSSPPSPATIAAAAPVDRASGGVVAYAQPPCIGADQVLLGGPIFYQGIPAYAARNTSTGALQAVDAVDCHVLDEVPAP